MFSNAALEWRPSVRRMLPDLAPRLAPGGRLAVQFPNNLYEPYRALLRFIAADGPWAKTLLPVAKSQPFNETMEGLYALIQPDLRSGRYLGATYLCVLSRISAIVDFMKASSLTSFLPPLDEARNESSSIAIGTNCASLSGAARWRGRSSGFPGCSFWPDDRYARLRKAFRRDPR